MPFAGRGATPTPMGMPLAFTFGGIRTDGCAGYWGDCWPDEVSTLLGSRPGAGN